MSEGAAGQRGSGAAACHPERSEGSLYHRRLFSFNHKILRWYPPAEDPALPIDLEMEPDIPDVELQRVTAER